MKKKKSLISKKLASWFFLDLQKICFYLVGYSSKSSFFSLKLFFSLLKIKQKKICSPLRLVLCAFKKKFSFIILIFSLLNFFFLQTLKLINLVLKEKLSFFAFLKNNQIISFFLFSFDFLFSLEKIFNFFINLNCFFFKFLNFNYLK